MDYQWPQSHADETDVMKPASPPADRPADRSAGAPADKPADPNATKPAGTQADPSAPKPAARPADPSAPKPVARPADPAAATTGARPADSTGDKTVAVQVDSTGDKTVSVPADATGDKTGDKTVAMKVDSTGDKTVAVPVDSAADKTVEVPPAKLPDKTAAIAANTTVARPPMPPPAPLRAAALQPAPPFTAAPPTAPPTARPTAPPPAMPPVPPLNGDAATPHLTGDEPTVKIKKPKPAGKIGLRKAGIVAGAVFGALALIYTIDLIASSGDVPRGVTVAGVDIGGESRDDAEQTLRSAIGPRLTEQVQVKAGDVESTVDPVKAGLTIDWTGTLDRAGDQPLNPFTRLTSLFTSREVGFVTTTDNAALTAAVEALRGEIDREPTEGGVKFEGITPVAVDPKDGLELDSPAARQALIDKWATGKTIELPVAASPVKTSADAVRKAVDEIAEPAVSGPVVVHGQGKDARLEPPAIAKALTFAPDGKGGLTAKIDQKKVVGAVGPQLKSTEVAGKDAEIVFTGGAPTVKPSVDGKGVDWNKSLTPLLDVLKKTDGRELDASYKHKPAKVTTAAANKLGIKEVIGEFTTGGFAPESGVNIRTVAAEVDGAIVKPGDTFSLNGFTGPRTAAEGYIEAGVIKEGAPSREVGGGISQFATTLYNASYFAAMTDAGHKEHSYYISRYPAAREATVFQNGDGSSVIDLKFTNDSTTGVAIQTIWTPSSITVKIWGTKRYEVESVTGGRSAFTNPETKQGPAENCHAGEGAQGFTTSDTRIVRDASTGAEVSRDTRSVRYNPQPKIVCGKPKPPGR